MKKALFYIFLLCVLVSPTCQAFSLPHAHQTAHTTSTHQVQKKQTKFTDSQFGELKVELLSDYDSDENEVDHDTVDDATVSDSDFIRNFFAVLTSGTPAKTKNAAYYAVNVSRLPRHNYISLQVFRI